MRRSSFCLPCRQIKQCVVCEKEQSDDAYLQIVRSAIRQDAPRVPIVMSSLLARGIVMIGSPKKRTQSKYSLLPVGDMTSLVFCEECPITCSSDCLTAAVRNSNGEGFCTRYTNNKWREVWFKLKRIPQYFKRRRS